MKSSASSAILATARTKPTITLMAATAAGTDIVRVVANVVHTSASRANPQLMFEALSEAVGKRLRAVPNTFNKLSSNSISDTVMGVMSLNKISKPYTEEAVAGFKSVSSNMFMDKESDMWRLEDTPGGKLLVKDNPDESVSSMKELLASLCSSSPWKSECSEIKTAVGGDFVSFVGLSGNLNYGFVISSISNSEDVLILPVDAEAPTEVAQAACVTVVPGEQLPDLEVVETPDVITSSARGGSSVDVVIEYYRRLYGNHKEFFSQLVDRIKNQAFA